ncbi:type II toxin-antitoxin system antitoxin SocA domain-containing protein [Catellatospora sp. NPDC049111]|uniref:Panacea domain-containing protein n=1 Tax=Catellatospora sp. NPDC049111 TaxID=3155271 RepID=UPI0033EC51A5
MATVHAVAAAVIDQLGPMTAMKLQKLVYYCQCWHLARTDRLIFSDQIEAWRQGPVVPSLYHRHRGHYIIDSWPHGDAATLSLDEQQSVDWVVDNYGAFSAIQLSRMTHNELPWKLARVGLSDNAASNVALRTDIIANFYSRQRADAETAVALAVASSALEGVELDEDWQERLRDVGNGTVSAEELIAEEIAQAAR